MTVEAAGHRTAGLAEAEADAVVADVEAAAGLAGEVAAAAGLAGEDAENINKTYIEKRADRDQLAFWF